MPRSKESTYPQPADVGNPPDVIQEWIDRVIASWNLTPKERDVCEAMLKGLATKEMAVILGNTEKTLKHHIYSILRKAHVESRSQLFAEILRR